MEQNVKTNLVIRLPCQEIQILYVHNIFRIVLQKKMEDVRRE